MKSISFKNSFIFFVRLADGRVQEMSFQADSTDEAVMILREHLHPDDEIMSCYKAVKSWKKAEKKKI